jgi:hypothetical protein
VAKEAKAGEKKRRRRLVAGPSTLRKREEDRAAAAARAREAGPPPMPEGDTEDPFAWQPGDETIAEIGESASISSTAPPSSGLPHGSSGTIDLLEDIIDTAGRRPARSGDGETPVRSATGGFGHIQSGSAGAASISAGSRTPRRKNAEEDSES